jgi:hypothetical protein
MVSLVSLANRVPRGVPTVRNNKQMNLVAGCNKSTALWPALISW